MKKLASLFLLLLAVTILWSCHKQDNNTTSTAGGSSVYLDLPDTPYDYTARPGVTLLAQPEYINRLAPLGRVLFYDAHLSVNNAISCASCHKQELGFADNVAFSAGFEGRLTGRNSPGLSGLGRSGLFFWDGRENQLQNLIMRPVSHHVEMGMENLDELPGKLAALPYYPALFKTAYGDENITNDRIAGAVSCFLQMIGAPSANSSFFLPINKPTDTANNGLTALQQQGRILFDRTYHCGSCHLSNGGYTGGGGLAFDIGLDEQYIDKGMGDVPGREDMVGMFKVPNLTNVALTAPYMHDGRYKTLNDVLEHYSHGIRNSPNLATLLRDSVAGGAMRMNIPQADKEAIIAFLGSLTNYSMLTDPKLSNPFKVK